MASTNKTTHYELSQYVGSDKPTYLTDYNNDMSAIDTGIYNAQTKADSAYTAAGLADGKAGDAQTTANAAVTSAGTANTNIGTMVNLTTTEKTTLVGAINEVNSFKEVFNLSNITTINQSSMIPSSNCTIAWGTIKLATNTDGSLFKFYGDLQIHTSATDQGVTITMPSSLRPSEQYTINKAGLFAWSSPQYPDYTMLDSADITIATDGTITIGAFIPIANDIRFQFSPCLYFNKSFGDIPSN